MAPKLEPRRHELVAIIGASETDDEWNDDLAEAAMEFGRLVGKNGHGIVTGGLWGVANSASEGCDAAGGLTMGILPGDEEVYGNAFLDLVVPTGLGEEASNRLVVLTAKAVIVFPGGKAVFDQAVFAFDAGRPILNLGNAEVSEVLDAIELEIDDLDAIELWIKALFE